MLLVVIASLAPRWFVGKEERIHSNVINLVLLKDLNNKEKLSFKYWRIGMLMQQHVEGKRPGSGPSAMSQVTQL